METAQFDKNEKWVKFYYFWKLQYEVRKHLIATHEKVTTRINALRDKAKELNCDKLAKSLADYEFDKNNFLAPVSKFTIPCTITEPDCLKCAGNLNISCTFTTVPNGLNIKKIVDNYDFKHYQLILDSTAFLIDLLEMNENNQSGIDYYIYDTNIQRKLAIDGFEIIGLQNLRLCADNSLTGNLLASIDISKPANEIFCFIKNLQNQKYEDVPSTDDITNSFKSLKDDFEFRKSLIEERYNPDFNISSFENRVLGLWLFDTISIKKIDFRIAVDRLRKGKWRGGRPCSTIDALSLSSNISEKTLRRAWKTTSECIKQGEVLTCTGSNLI